jgi:hypothetical protein
MWFKNRTVVGDHGLMDAVRGVNKIIHSNDTNAEVTSNGTTNITAFTSNGFTYGASSLLDTGSGTPVTWLWKANGAGSANTDGSISSTVSASATSGFSIVSYTGTGSNATVGHGLGVAPKMIFVKGRNTSSINWLTGGTNISSNWGSSLHLNITGGLDTYNYWQNQAPNANTFALATDSANNESGMALIAYCFADVQGYSKFGSYIGNNSATDGTFFYTGFKPAMIIIKKTDNGQWTIFDNKRNPSNAVRAMLVPNGTDVELSQNENNMDFLSNGVKMYNGDGVFNAGGSTYIYMAFAEEPLVGDNPATAR